MTTLKSRGHLKPVTPEFIKQQEKQRQWEEEWYETRKPAKWRAHKIREDIEALAVGLKFGIPYLADPEMDSLDLIPHWPPVLFNPSIDELCDRLGDRLEQDDRNDLCALRSSVNQAAFIVGVFAGRIFQGASKPEIAQMEASLARAIEVREQGQKS